MNIPEQIPPIGQFTLRDFIDQSQCGTSAFIDRESSDCLIVSREGIRGCRTYYGIILVQTACRGKKNPEGGQVF